MLLRVRRSISPRLSGVSGVAFERLTRVPLMLTTVAEGVLTAKTRMPALRLVTRQMEISCSTAGFTDGVYGIGLQVDRSDNATGASAPVALVSQDVGTATSLSAQWIFTIYTPILIQAAQPNDLTRGERSAQTTTRAAPLKGRCAQPPPW